MSLKYLSYCLLQAVGDNRLVWKKQQAGAYIYED